MAKDLFNEMPKGLMHYTKYEPLLNLIENNRYGDSFSLGERDRTHDMLDAIQKAAVGLGDKPLARVMESILLARSGDFTRPIPRMIAAPDMFKAFFRHHHRDGWIYDRGPDGHLHAYLLTNVIHETDREGSAYTALHLVHNGWSGNASDGSVGLLSRTRRLDAESVTRKRIEAILTDAGLFVETEALRAEYDANLARYLEVLPQFAKQFHFSGTPLATDNWRNANDRSGRKVIHDMPRSKVRMVSRTETKMFDWVETEEPEGKRSKGVKKVLDADVLAGDQALCEVPTHFAIPVFDLHSHDFFWANALDLTEYTYDKSLADKIVLPEDQRNLLNILTSNLDDFTGDVIEGKTAGNVVLCKGAPGVGKTLTAEVYAELIERPLYSIHSGTLGITADTIRKNLEVVFVRSKRWDAVLLLDEADVFVLERGDNLEQNAIVAEFLRTLEYFDGLMFMTTNRADNIDDAILSRAAAIIDYRNPDMAGIRAVWKVQAANQGTTIPKALLDDLVSGFEVISPRDVKMLLRLALRVAASEGVPLNVSIVERCAMFRGLHYSKGSRK